MFGLTVGSLQALYKALKFQREVFGGTPGDAKLYSMLAKNYKRLSTWSMFGLSMGSLQALHEALKCQCEVFGGTLSGIKLY